jgi:hypothetical protein
VGVGDAADQVLCLEPVDGVRHARGVHLQALADPAQRQRPGAAEEQEHEELVAGEREVERPEHLLDPRQHDLLGAHQRGHRGHPARDVAPAVRLPLPAGLRHRVERQGTAWCHGASR